MKLISTSMIRTLGFLLVSMVLAGCGPEGTGPTVSELMQKGAKQAVKDDLVAMTPVNFFFKWPSKEGEANLTYNADGTLTATGKHYASGTTSPGTGTWNVNEKGQFCTEQNWTTWKTSNSACYFMYMLPSDQKNAYLSPSGENNVKTFALAIEK